MVTESGVRAAADRIRAREAPAGGVRDRVSVRTVRKELGGGSFTDIARELARWRNLAGYDPVTERADLPEAFARRLTLLGREMLELARVEASREGLPGFAAAEAGQRRERDLLDEALDRVDALEERLAALQGELERLRGAGATATAAAVAAPDPAVRAMRGFRDAVMDRSLGRDADTYWEAVRVAVRATMDGGRSVGAHEIHRSLPPALRERGHRVGLPLTVGWLRHHLLREAEAGRGVVERGGRFALAGDEPSAAAPAAVPPAGTPLGSAGTVSPALSPRRFLVLFVGQVHALLAERGALSADDVLAGLPSEWVRATSRYGPAGAGRPILASELRAKLRVRIDRGRPFAELVDGRFEAVAGTGRDT